MSPELVLLIGNPRPGSRTRAAAERVGRTLERGEPNVIELADVTALGYGPEPVAPAHADTTALERVRAAQVLVVATPSYKGTFTGLLKVFLDRLPHLALAGVTAVPVAVAASPAHAEATVRDLARLLRELGASVDTEVALLESQLDDGDLDGRLGALVRRHVSPSVSAPPPG